MTVPGCTEISLFRHSQKHVYRSLQFWKDVRYKTHVFFFKSLKLNADFRSAVKNLEKIFSFSDNFIWIGCRKFSVLPVKYISSGNHVFRNDLKISDIIKEDFLQLRRSQSDDQRWSHYCRGDFRSVWDRLNSWLS